MNRLLVACCLLVAGCASGPGPRAPTGTPTAADIRTLGVIMGHLPGTFDSIAQDKGAPGPGVRMRWAPFWREREEKGEYWFYVEHSRIAEDPKPFQQRIYRFIAFDNNFYADIYALPGDPKDFVGEWRKPQPFAAFKPDELHEYAGCRHKVGHMTMMFWARIETKTCHAEHPEVAYETSEIFASSVGMKQGTFGWDAAGKKVLGESSVWDFRRYTTELR
jgi:hypothetical protein